MTALTLEEKEIRALKRQKKIILARSSFLDFVQLMMPHPEDQTDPDMSLYEVEPHHLLIIELIERVARGECLRGALAVPPQHGKSQLMSRLAPAWISGLFPHKDIIFGTYNQDFANEFGAEVREFMLSPTYAQIFPKTVLRKGSKSKDLLVTTQNGHLAFIGRNASGTGKPADFFFIDDPLKNAQEAESAASLKELHSWYAKVVYTRVRVTTAVLITQTRWCENDLIGALCDADHPNRKRGKDGAVAADDSCWDWTFVNIPAVLRAGKIADALGVELKRPSDPKVIEQFGSEPMAALWPKRFPLAHLASAARLDPLGFNALYMGKPTPDDGEYFRADWFVEYDPEDLPRNLRKYGASDHAVSEKTKTDFTVLGCVGIDENDDIWVLPDLVWERMETDRTVEELLAKFQAHQPLLWWMEDEIISKAFGPFLRKRMQEEKTYVAIDPVRPSTDKRSRARSAQGRLAMRKVRFPRFAPWWRDARSQLLKFPMGTKDDFVDWLAHICQGLTKEVGADKTTTAGNVIKVGSLAWIKKSTANVNRKERMAKAIRGW